MAESIISCFHRTHIFKMVMASFLNRVFPNVFYIGMYKLYEQNVPILNKC